MTEIVERVARAIEAECAGCDPRDFNPFLAAARAAIAEMREPTEAMLGAAEASYEVQPRKVWRAMCVAAMGSAQ